MTKTRNGNDNRKAKNEHETQHGPPLLTGFGEQTGSGLTNTVSFHTAPIAVSAFRTPCNYSGLVESLRPYPLQDMYCRNKKYYIT